MEQIDRVAIAPLKVHYGQRKFYKEYLPVLGIQTQKDGRNAYITQDEAHLLEGYHEARGKGKEAIADFLTSLGHVPEHVSEYVPNLSKPPVSERIPTRTETRSTSAETTSLAADISRIELLKLAGKLQEMNSVARWLATSWVLQMVAVQRIVIIRSVLLVLLDREKLPRLRHFKARGFEFRRVDDRNNEEWLASMLEVSQHGQLMGETL